MTSLNSTLSGSRVSGQVYNVYCVRKIIAFGLPDADRQRYIDKFKSLGIDKCPYEIPSTEWTDDSAVPENRVDNMTVDSY